MKKNLLCAAIAALTQLYALSAYAELRDADLPVNHLNVDTRLRTVVVTASKVEEKIDDSLASVTVLDRNDIETLQAKDFRDLISHVPGVDISTSGSAGSATSLFLRGTNSRHTLFLIDGQRVSSATLGTTNLQFLDPAQIERIEVVRGPKSSLYGSDAIGGVIHIFTRKAQQNKSSAYASAGAGARNSYQGSVGGQTHYDKWRASANLSYSETNGFSNTHSNKSAIKDDDGYRNTSASTNIGYDFNPTTSLDISHFYVKARNESDESSATYPYSDNWIQTTSGSFKTQILPLWKMTLSASRNTDDSDYFGRFPSNVRTTRKSSSLQNDFTLSESHVITVGGDYDKDEVEGSTTFVTPIGKEIKDRDNKAGFIQYMGQFGILDTQLGARHDDNDTYGSHKTENAAIGINFPENHKVIFSYGTAFQAPSFNQLYYPGFGNPSLDPERSKNYEVEFRGNYSTFNWSASAFQNDIKDLIQNVLTGSSLLPQNFADVRIRGIELIASTKIDEWMINASLTYTDPQDQETDKVLVNRSRRSAKIDADRSYGKWSFGTSFRAQDERYANTTNTTRLGGYGLLDLRGGYAFTNNLGVQLKLTNIFDKSYQLNNNFNTERFGGFATINYRL